MQKENYTLDVLSSNKESKGYLSESDLVIARFKLLYLKKALENLEEIKENPKVIQYLNLLKEIDDINELKKFLECNCEHLIVSENGVSKCIRCELEFNLKGRRLYDLSSHVLPIDVSFSEAISLYNEALENLKIKITNSDDLQMMINEMVGIYNNQKVYRK